MIEQTGPGVFLMQLLPFVLLALLVFGVISLFSSRSGVNPVVRFFWFLFIGWWLGLIWFGLSLALMMTIIFFPIGAYTATKTWKVMTLSGSESPRDAVSDVKVDVENKVNQEVNNSSEVSEAVKEDEDFDEKLQKLKDLKEDDVITEEEFEQKKEDIMEDI